MKVSLAAVPDVYQGIPSRFTGHYTTGSSLDFRRPGSLNFMRMICFGGIQAGQQFRGDNRKPDDRAARDHGRRGDLRGEGTTVGAS